MSVTVERLVAEIEADPSGAIRGLGKLETALASTTRDRHANVDVDTGSAMAQAAKLGTNLDATARDRSINLDVDTGSALAQITALNAALTLATQDRNIKIDVDHNSLSSLGADAMSASGSLGSLGASAGEAGGKMGSMGSSLGSLSGAIVPMIGMVGVFGSLLALLPGAFAAAATGAGVLFAALAPLVGLLGALPVVLGAAGAGLAAVALVAAPLMNAFSAMGAAGQQAGQQADDLARRQRELAAAQRALTEATIGVARAERELADARENLANAPAEARGALADQRMAVRAAILSERQAVMSLQQAQMNLNSIQNKNSDSTKNLIKQTDEFTGKVYDVAFASADAQQTAMDEKAARLQLAQAELAVAQAKDNTGDSQKKLTEMEKKGIKNSDVVVSARERLVDAQFRVVSAHDAVAAATERIADAQEKLTKGTADQSAATRNLASAMGALTPEGQRFVRFLYDEFRPALSDISKQVQKAMIPGLQAGFESILSMKGEIGNGLAGFGKVIGDDFGRFFEYWARGANKKRLTGMFDGLIDVTDNLLKLMTPLSDVIVSITEAATPMVNLLTNQMIKGLKDLADWMQTDNGKNKTKQFFDDAAKFTGLWMDVLGPITGILSSIAEAAKPLAETWLKDMAEHFQSIDDNLNTSSGLASLTSYFEDALPVLKETSGLLGDVMDVLTGGDMNTILLRTLKAVRAQIPKIENLMSSLADSDVLPNLVDLMGNFVDVMSAVPWSYIGQGIGLISGALGFVADILKVLPDGIRTFFFAWAGLALLGNKFEIVGKAVAIMGGNMKVAMGAAGLLGLGIAMKDASDKGTSLGNVLTGALGGAAIGTAIMPGIGTLIGGVAGGGLVALAGAFGDGKNKAEDMVGQMSKVAGYAAQKEAIDGIRGSLDQLTGAYTKSSEAAILSQFQNNTKLNQPWSVTHPGSAEMKGTVTGQETLDFFDKLGVTNRQLLKAASGNLEAQTAVQKVIDKIKKTNSYAGAKGLGVGDMLKNEFGTFSVENGVKDLFAFYIQGYKNFGNTVRDARQEQINFANATADVKDVLGTTVEGLKKWPTKLVTRVETEGIPDTVGSLQRLIGNYYDKLDGKKITTLIRQSGVPLTEGLLKNLITKYYDKMDRRDIVSLIRAAGIADTRKDVGDLADDLLAYGARGGKNFADGMTRSLDDMMSDPALLNSKWGQMFLGGVQIPGNPLANSGDISDSSLGGLVPTPKKKGRWSGGAVKNNTSYMVGENGPELFTPDQGGRIAPAGVSRDLMKSNGEGVSDQQLERVLRAVQGGSGKKVEINQTFNEKVDPHHLSRELAWSLG